ncbi:alpha-ribazole phosphatase [Lutibacter sp.]|uniref:alpha-ribazole phosphatase n=1 Tax=Lutibacter sp. TaxID=1925666 RepID=UPI0035628313
MEIYLIRHTTPNIEKNICYGQLDIDVTNSFENEASKITTAVSSETGTLVYSSPLKRCIKLASKFSQNIITDKRLMELNFGDWENHNWDAIPKTELDVWMNDFVNVSIPNGEAYTDLFKRATEFFYEITSNNNSKKIIITTHGGVIRSIVANINNIPLSKSFDFKIEYGQIIKIVKQNNSYKIL